MKELKEEEKIEIVKVIAMILLIIIIMIGLAVDNTHAETLEDIDVVIIQSGGYTEYARCEDTYMCNVYNKGDVRYTQIIFRYNFKAGNKYKFTTRVGYMFGKTAGLTEGQNYISSKRAYIYNATYGSQDITCSVDEILDYDVTNNVSWDDVNVGGAVTFERNMNCEFTANYDSTSLTAYITMTNSGLNSASAYLVTRAEIVGGESVIDIIDNANKNQEQTNERLDNIDNHLKDILEGEEYVKPEKNEDIANLEEQEEDIYDLFEYDPNSVTIGINDSATRKIFEILSRIITQNEIIQTLIITILSISIIKLVLGR